MSAEPRLYHDLAPWWPLLSAPEEYAEEAAYAARVLASAARPVREVLELGSGGGNNASHLKASFAMTLVDRSPAMLEVSKRLNPECRHAAGDMRDVRLGETFDAVFVHDAVMYLTREHDLRAAMDTAFAHCRPGGVVVVVPDCTAETFEPTTSHGGHDGDDGRGLRYLEWDWDPDPTDTEFRMELAVLLRSADGTVDVVHDTHRCGLFPEAAWTRLLAEAGFVTEVLVEETAEARPPRTVFVGRRPVAGS